MGHGPLHDVEHPLQIVRLGDVAAFDVAERRGLGGLEQRLAPPRVDDELLRHADLRLGGAGDGRNREPDAVLLEELEQLREPARAHALWRVGERLVHRSEREGRQPLRSDVEDEGTRDGSARHEIDGLPEGLLDEVAEQIAERPGDPAHQIRGTARRRCAPRASRSLTVGASVCSIRSHAPRASSSRARSGSICLTRSRAASACSPLVRAARAHQSSATPG